MAGDLPPSAGSVSADILATLLDLQGERDWLDYKRQCDLSSARGLVEFAKDVGAMMITGGYIVVGADADGTVNPDGVAIDHDQLVYQYARHLGLPVDPVSPAERRQRYENKIRAAKEELRQR